MSSRLDDVNRLAGLQEVELLVPVLPKSRPFGMNLFLFNFAARSDRLEVALPSKAEGW